MYKFSRLFVAFALGALCVSNASADSNHRIQVLSTNNLSSLDEILDSGIGARSLVNKSQRSLNLDQDVKIRMHIRGVGRIESSLSKQRFFDIKSGDSAFLQGEAAKLSGSSGHKQASFATVVNGSNGDKILRLFAVGNSRKVSKHSWKGILELRAKITNSNGKFKMENLSFHRSKRSSADMLGCLEGAKAHSAAHHAQHDGASIKAEVQIAKILLEADTEYVDKLSTSMPVELATVINGVDTIYQRDLGLSFDTTIADRPTEYSANVAYDENFEFLIHQEMRALQPAASRGTDIHFLFTGKTPVGEDLSSLLGVVPQIGAVCKTPENSIGITIRPNDGATTALDIVVTAHEIGHLYGAEHDDNFTDPNNPNIMSSGVSDTITTFSNYSYNQIGTFVSGNGSCLVAGTGTGGGGGSSTLPDTAKLYSFKRGKYFAVELYDSVDDTVLAGYTISALYRKNSRSAYQVTKELVTNSDGIARIRPKKRGQYLFEATTISNISIRSKKLQLK